MRKIALFFASMFLMVLTINGQTVNLTLNPYADVNWSTVNQYKANYHTHTTNSDGSQSPSTVINEYGSKGYDILSITDHNVTTWPWPHNNYGMLAIKGNEYSSSHHMCAMADFTNSSGTLENGIPHVQSHGGITQINHPGRYESPSNWSWYIPWFRDYSTCTALEVFNQGDRYSSDRQLWDNINENLFPATGKLAWGTSNDDKHSTSHLYGNFNFMLMPDLTKASWEECMTKGAFYFCREPGESGDANVPRISNIVVDNNAKTIIITASGYNNIQWIGPGTSVVATGNVFNYASYTDQPFVRAVLDGSNGDSYTQPFGFETVAGGNQAPSVSVTAPSNGTHYDNPQTITISANASDSDGSVASVEFFVNGSSIGSDNSAPYTKSYAIPADGSYSITARATDNEGATATSSAVSVTVGVTAETVSARINSSMNDVEERGDGSMYTNSSDIELVYDGSNQTIGLRFVGLNIPQGATITAANIQFTCDETNSTATNLTIKGHDANNSSAFTTASNNVSSRTTTSASVNWSPAAWNSVGEAGANQRTPDLSAIVQEIVNRSGYTHNSAITMIITGTGERTAEAYDGTSSSAALLTVDYITGQTPTNDAPTVAITAPSNSTSFDEGTVVYMNANASDSDGTIAQVEFFVNGSSIGVETSAPYERNWTIGVGSYNITAVATDNDGASTTSSVISITGNPVTGGETVTTSARISSSINDVEEDPTNGSVYTNSSDIELVYDSYNNGNQTVGLRFTGLNIPQGVTINSAYVEFTVDESQTGTCNLTIKGHDTDNSSAFTTSAYSVSSRSTTNTSVNWTPSGWSSVGSKQQSPDLSAIVQEIVNRSGFSSSSAISLVVTGSGTRTTEAYDGSSSDAALLVVEYTTGGGSAPTEDVLTYDDFESGWGNYTDGGGDCYRYTGGTYAHQGSDALAIQDNSGTASSFWLTNGIDISSYDNLTVEFWYMPVSMDNSNEDFWLQYYNGSSWTTIGSWARSTDFENNNFYFESVTISKSSYNFPNNAKIRFMCDASGNADDVYIDEISIIGSTGTPKTAPASNVKPSNESIENNLDSEFSFTLFPNPCKNYANVSLQSEYDAFTVSIFNMNGKLCKRQNISGNETQIYLDGLNSGLYIVTVKSGANVKTERLIVK